MEFVGVKKEGERLKCQNTKCVNWTASIWQKNPQNIPENDDAFEELMKEVEEYHKNCTKALEMGQVNGHQHYPLEMCRKEISRYKQIYKMAKNKKMHKISIFRLLERAFGVATLGYQLYKVEDLKNDGENFAKTAEKFGKILGRMLVNKGVPGFWKPLYETFELQMSHQPYGTFYQSLSLSWIQHFPLYQSELYQK